MRQAPPALDKWVNLDNMSQLTHLFVSMFLVEHGGRWLGHPLWWLAGVMVLAGIKEAIIDPRYESPAVAGNGWKDWASFAVGAVAGFLLAAVKS